ncbi:MAG: hypothetical protein ACK5JT_03495 [Hyphomicrobiaceae bacterium]
MQLSIEGLLVVLALYLLDRALDGRLVIALLMSLAFGATAFATLPALGGSSPLIYTIFALALGVVFVRRRDFVPELARLFRINPIGWAIVLIIVYALMGAIILPRLFAGATTVYVVERGATGTAGVVPVRLAPGTYNVSQAAYFALAAASYFTVLSVAIAPGGLRRLRIAIFAWAIMIAATGYIDLIGKLAGLGDILEPIRTASYTMLTGEDNTISGLPRISGAFSEASGFSAVSVPAAAFALSYWRVLRTPLVLFLFLLLLVLVLLSTSTTAYVTLVICTAWLCLAAIIRLLLARIDGADLVLIGLALLVVAVVTGIYLYDPNVFSPFLQMLDEMLIHKSTSSSAIERGEWNEQGLRAFLDTFGGGVGIGSTRTSSWAVAVVAQLGVLGALALAGILVVLVNGAGRVSVTRESRPLLALANGCRAAALAGLVSDALTSSTSDPGMFFYIALATIVAVSRELAARRVSLFRSLPVTDMPQPDTLRNA